MRKKLWTCLALMLVIPGLLFMTSCAKQATGTGVKKVEPVDTDQPVVEKKDSDDDKTAPPTKIDPLDPADVAAREAEMAKNRFLGDHVYFEFDKATLTEASQDLLKEKAEWLRDNPVNVTIGGHCDERGTTEYNMVLGAERAESVKNFLVNLGISASSMTTISYGEEDPVDSGSDEEAWAKNRRAQFSL